MVKIRLRRCRISNIGTGFTAAALGLMFVVLSACGGNGSSPGGKEAGAGDGVFPVTIEHAFGATVVPKAPERVVSVGYTEQDALLALGVVPVGVTDWYGDQPFATWPWAQPVLGDAKPAILSLEDGFQFEKIAALKPDILIGTNAGMTEQDYKKLSAIAPTIAQRKGDTAFFSRWDVQALTIGEAIGKKAEAQRLVEEVKQRFADAAEAHPEFAGKKVIFLQNAFYDGNAIAYQKGLSTEFLTSLGLEIPSSIDRFTEADGTQASIPMEQLGVLNDADILLWATEKPEDRTALEAEPLYRALEPVRSGHLVFTDATTAGAIYFTSLLSLPRVLDKLVPALASAIGGEGPATTV